MKGLRKIISVALCLVMLTGVIGIGGSVFTASAAGKTTVTVPVTYCQTEARSILALVNSLRTEGNPWYWKSDNKTKEYPAGLKALTYDYQLEEIAMQRAAEIVLKFSHTRPNGTDSLDMIPMPPYTIAGENVAAGQKTAQEAETAWEEADANYAGQGHRRNLLNSKFTTIGIACAQFGKVKYWVQVLGNPKSSTAATTANDSAANVSVEVMSTDITTGSVTANPTSISLGVNSSAALPVVSQEITYKGDPQQTFNSQKTVSWKVKDTSIAQISGNNIVGKSAGSTTLTGTYDGSKTVTVPVTVSGSATTYTLTFNANGGSGAPSKLTGNGNISLPTATPSKDGYKFLGWAESSSATAAKYAPGDTYDLKKNSTLYAVWEVKVESPTANSKINAKTSAKVDYKTQVIITATGTNIPSGYKLAIFEGNKIVATGDRNTVTYDAGNLTKSKVYTVSVIDGSNNVQENDAGDLTKTIEITVNAGFIAMIVAFFRGLFGSLPTVEVKP